MSKNIKFILLTLSLLVLLVWAYSNHFNNGFYFDDIHTISTNDYITDLSNFKLFFTDGSTFSSLPANQAYRPMVTLMNAIDYRIAGGLDPFYFHLSIFFWYIVQLVLMFFFFRFILKQCFSSSSLISFVSVAAVGLYAVHAANAETINYIISRSDSFSTLCVIGAFVAYQNTAWRKWQLHLPIMVVGIWTKQTGVMFAPLLFLYVFIFENPDETSPFNSLDSFIKQSLQALRSSASAFIVGVGLFVLNQFLFTPQTTVSSNTGVSKWDYFMTQWYISTHYLSNFILPLDLSADPDFVIISSISDPRIAFGLLTMLVMLFIAFIALKNKPLRPVAFGIAWYFIALLPSSSFVPLFQIANDHRTFFPYVGLILAVGTFALYLIEKYRPVLDRTKIAWPSLITYFMLICCAMAYGTHQRNKVWSSSETLWYDVTQKSPKNGRGLMNYGLTQMSKGKYDVALKYFKEAEKTIPRYSYLHINMGILKNAMGKNDQAEKHFKLAIKYDDRNPESFYFYADWLYKQGKKDKAIKHLETTLALSPGHKKAKSLLKKVKASSAKDKASFLEMIEKATTADELVNISLSAYNNKRYGLCIKACEKAIEINPNSAVAYNNMCSAYNKKKEWAKAELACQKALEIDPGFDRARNNLNWAQAELKKANK